MLLSTVLSVADVGDRRTPPVRGGGGMPHRIMLNYAAHSDGIDGAHIVERVVRSIHSARPA